MNISVRFADLLAIYRAELLERTIPFWLTHAMDWKQGGICTCIADTGEILSADKYMWSQLRALWTFSALYNQIEKRQEWLDAAYHIFAFARQYSRDPQGRWVFTVDAQGNVLQGATSIYADGFAIYGLTEFARATGSQEAIDLARATYENVQRPLLEKMAVRMWEIIRQTNDSNMAQAQYGMFRFAPVGPEPLDE